MTQRTEEEDPSSRPGDGAAPHSAHLQLVRHDDETGERETSLFGFIRSLIGSKSETTLHQALKDFVEEGEVDQSLGSDEKALISNILTLRDLRASDVMIPRADIVAIDSSISTSELFTLLAEEQFSRFPVYRETLDDVIGTLHIKDVLSCMAKGQPIELEQLVREAPIVSPSLHVLDLLLEMKNTRRHLALVVDEYGGIDGLVTIGDIIAAIVGEIADEHETSDQPSLVETADGTILADGRVDLETFELRFGNILNREDIEDVDTLGGLVSAIAGHMPSRGEVVTHDSGLVFEVLDADPRRVHRLRIRNIPKPAPSE